MAFWGDDRWIASNEHRDIVEGFDGGNLSDGCYKLAIGDEAMVSSNRDSSENAYRRLGEHDTLPLLPGQFAYLITAETIHVPTDALGFINVDTQTKLRGLINVSGFHVDPGYEGKVIFTVFNASPATITLHRGMRMFRLWIADYEGGRSRPKKGYAGIPKGWADRLQGTYPSPFALARRLDEVEQQISNLRRQRLQLFLIVFIGAVFLFPFAASLYASFYASAFGKRAQGIEAGVERTFQKSDDGIADDRTGLDDTPSKAGSIAAPEARPSTQAVSPHKH